MSPLTYPTRHDEPTKAITGGVIDLLVQRATAAGHPPPPDVARRLDQLKQGLQ